MPTNPLPESVARLVEAADSAIWPCADSGYRDLCNELRAALAAVRAAFEEPDAWRCEVPHYDGHPCRRVALLADSAPLLCGYKSGSVTALYTGRPKERSDG